MNVSFTIKQFGFRLRADPEEIPFQHSANIQMKFEKDENFIDYAVVGYYIPPGESEAKLLNINDDGTFTLGPDCFKNRGTLSFSFNLVNSIEEVHLGSIDFDVRHAFGDSSSILPEPEEVWISVVTKVAEDAIKEDVELVKQKAKEASQSALTASEKANEAQEYANNAKVASNSATTAAGSAITAKDDAIAASNQAFEFSNNASESAIEAKNSADEALENANTSNKAIETVNQIKTQIEDKANEFDTNYQEKLTAFNDNATEKQNAFNQSVTSANDLFDKKVVDANNDLDSKLQQANTTINEKVTEATNQANEAKKQAQIATDEVAKVPNLIEGKLDKNLGLESKDKVLVTDADGNVTTQNKEDFEGGGTGNYNDLENKPTINGVELSGNKTSSDLKMYTQEEVNYLLNDKMDKPYYGITITDDTTIENTLAGNFKIDSIEGSIYQAEESGIVPTPERPIPIRSKKITVDGEIVELRSLKESRNLFDKNLLIISKTDSQRDTPAIQLKDKETYTISCSKNGVECILGVRAKRKSDNLDVEIQLLRGLTEQGSFTVDYTTYENYLVRVYSTAYDTIDTIQLELGSSATSYVPPTVRDYKIVDHATKTSKIVRNVGYKLFTNGDNFYKSCYGGMEIQLQDVKRQSAAVNTKSYCNMFYASHKEGIPENLRFRLGNQYLLFNYDGYNDIDKWREFLNSNELYFAYELATPTEESIPYVETDTSEVGLSWQDTTSPSPDISSDIYEVDEINVKLVGKNLLNKDNINIDSLYVKYDKLTFPCVTKEFDVDKDGVVTLRTPTQNSIWCQMKVEIKPNTKYILSLTNIDGLSSEQISGFVIRGVTLYNESNEVVGGNWDKGSNTFTTNEQTAYAILALTFWRTSANTTIKFKIQIEEGSVATTYEPYQETSIQHALSKPLRATKDGSIKDTIDIVNSEVTYNITDFTVDGNTTIALGTDKEKTRVIQINSQPFLNPTNNLKMYCDKLLNDSGKDEELFTVSTALFIGIDKNRVEANDINAFKKWFGENPLYFIGISKTPTTEPLDDELVQKLKTLKTFSPVTHVFITGIAKPKLNAKYPKDIASAQAQLEQKFITLQEAVIKNV